MFGSKAASSSSDADDIVALINLRGVISDSTGGGGGFGKSGGITFQNVRHLLEQAFAIPKVLAVVLVINSPGGSPTQTNLIGSFLRSKADTTKVPVLAVVEDVAASGGYWLACAADEIYIDPNSMVGSIGVIFQNIGFHEAMKKVGIEARIITSVKNKAGLNPMMEYDKDQEQIIKENMTVVHNNFVDWVKKRRPNLKDNKDVFSGRVFVGEDAKEKGLVDGVATLSEMLEKKFPDREDLKLIEVKRKMDGGIWSLLGQLFGRSSHVLGQLSDTLDKIQGNLNLPQVRLYDYH